MEREDIWTYNACIYKWHRYRGCLHLMATCIGQRNTVVYTYIRIDEWQKTQDCSYWKPQIDPFRWALTLFGLMWFVRLVITWVNQVNVGLPYTILMALGGSALFFFSRTNLPLMKFHEIEPQTLLVLTNTWCNVMTETYFGIDNSICLMYFI